MGCAETAPLETACCLLPTVNDLTSLTPGDSHESSCFQVSEIFVIIGPLRLVQFNTAVNLKHIRPQIIVLFGKPYSKLNKNNIHWQLTLSLKHTVFILFFPPALAFSMCCWQNPCVRKKHTFLLVVSFIYVFVQSLLNQCCMNSGVTPACARKPVVCQLSRVWKPLFLKTLPSAEPFTVQHASLEVLLSLWRFKLTFRENTEIVLLIDSLLAPCLWSWRMPILLSAHWHLNASLHNHDFSAAQCECVFWKKQKNL